MSCSTILLETLLLHLESITFSKSGPKFLTEGSRPSFRGVREAPDTL